LARRKVSLSPSFLQYARKFFSFVKSFLSFLLLYSFQRTVESHGSLKTEQYFEISDVRPTRS